MARAKAACQWSSARQLAALAGVDSANLRKALDIIKRSLVKMREWCAVRGAGHGGCRDGWRRHGSSGRQRPCNVGRRTVWSTFRQTCRGC